MRIKREIEFLRELSKMRHFVEMVEYKQKDDNTWWIIMGELKG